MVEEERADSIYVMTTPDKPSGAEDYVVENGTRLAQMVIAKYEKAEIEVVEDLESTDRGEKGFGSTGTNK